MAEQNGFVRDYAWFVTDEVIRNEKLVQAYPIGLVAVNVSQDLSPKALLPDTVRLIGAALRSNSADKKAVVDATPGSGVEATRGSGRRVKEHNGGCWISAQNRSLEGNRLYRSAENTVTI